MRLWVLATLSTSVMDVEVMVSWLSLRWRKKMLDVALGAIE